MIRKLIYGFLVLGLFAGCSKENDSEVPDKDEEPGKRSTVRSLTPGRGDTGRGGAGRGGADADVEAGGGGVPNAYADEHWADSGEVSNEWTAEFKSADTPDARIAVLERKQSSGPEMLAPLIRLSLRDPEERVRTEAVKMLSSFGVSRDEAVDLVVGAAHDPSSEVRILAMESAVELPAEIQLGIYEKTIAIPHEEVRKMTITELGRMMSKPAFDVLISGLEDPDPDFRKAVNFEINLLVRQSFDSHEEAKAWWDGNLQRFTDNMIEIGGSK